MMPRRCVHCGRFMSRYGRCSQEIYSWYYGVWEHR